jgi:hypothetical protein
MKTLTLLSCSIWIAAALAGCTSAGRCERGEAGCIADEDGDCAPGPRTVGDMCVDDDAPSAGRGGSGGSGGADAGPVMCTDDSVEEACQAFCEIYCQNQDRLCVDSRCSPGDCDPGGDFEQDCVSACEGDVECAMDLCVAQIDIECKDFGYIDDKFMVDGMEVDSFISLCDQDDPVCVPGADVGCSNLCGERGIGVGAELVDDGVCDDGGPDSADTERPKCARGTDCTDCGVRVCKEVDGANPSCDGHGDCCGFYDGEAFCVELGSGAVCLATCTETRTCTGNLSCLLVDDEENRVCAPP